MSRRRVCVVTGSRAEYGLLYWLLNALRESADVELQLVVTGTHLSAAFGMTVRTIESDGFPIALRVPINVDDDSPRGVTRSMAQATMGMADALASLRPDVLVLLGDRYEALAAAQAAMVARVPIAHIHGGEATEGLIDEAIRHAVTKMAHLHFVAAEPFRRRVIQLGESPDRVWVVGATGLDNIAGVEALGRDALEDALGIKLAEPLYLVTYHPVTLSAGDPGLEMRTVLKALDDEEPTLVLTGVNADAGGGSIRREAQQFADARCGRVLLAETLGTLHYLSLMRLADVVVGNSSSGLLEAPAIGTPSLDIGERQRGRLRAPSVIHCAVDEEEIRQALRQARLPAHRTLAARRETPYGQPGAARRIASILREHTLQGLVVKRFHDLPWVCG